MLPAPSSLKASPLTSFTFSTEVQVRSLEFKAGVDRESVAEPLMFVCHTLHVEWSGREDALLAAHSKPEAFLGNVRIAGVDWYTLLSTGVSRAVKRGDLPLLTMS